VTLADALAVLEMERATPLAEAVADDEGDTDDEGGTDDEGDTDDVADALALVVELVDCEPVSEPVGVSVPVDVPVGVSVPVDVPELVGVGVLVLVGERVGVMTRTTRFSTTVVSRSPSG